MEDLDFDLDDLNDVDTAEMTVVAKGKLTDWKWTFAGPGHEKAIAQSNRIARERLHENREKEQAQVNGRKWKAAEETPDEVRSTNARFIVERLITWSSVKTKAGADFPFSEKNAMDILLDPRKGKLMAQCLEFLGGEASFTPRSVKGSPPSPSLNSASAE